MEESKHGDSIICADNGSAEKDANTNEKIFFMFIFFPFLLFNAYKEVGTTEGVALSLSYLNAGLCLELLADSLCPCVCFDRHHVFIEEWNAYILELTHLLCLTTLLRSSVYGILAYPVVEKVAVSVVVVTYLIAEKVDAGTVGGTEDNSDLTSVVAKVLEVCYHLLAKLVHLAYYQLTESKAMDVSEPEAYAACALKTFGFIPSEEKPVNYAIFDFGGGTADFAYGYWKKPGEDDRENFSFEIENITTDGDKYLGGENLLEGLAFEVFADEDNRKKLDDIRSNPGYDCRFNYGIPEQETRGIPVRYLSNQQPAKKNMREMAEEMRKYWENEEDYFSELLHNGKKSYSVTDIENIIASLIEKVNLAGLISAGEELEKILESVKSGNETPANAFLKIERIKKNNDISLDDEDPDTINFS